MSWLKTRNRTHALKVSVARGEHEKVEIELDQTADSAEIVERILRAVGEHRDGA
jgi:hypothetical protein